MKKKMNDIVYFKPFWTLATTLEKTLFRPLPSLTGTILCAIFLIIIHMVSFVYLYRIESVDILVPIYIVGYIMGCIFEYIRLLHKHSRS